MANKMLDFKGFKKVADDSHKATLKHPEGHEIHISKGSLSPALKKQLEKLPLHQAEPDSEVVAPEENPFRGLPPSSDEAPSQNQDPTERVADNISGTIQTGADSSKPPEVPGIVSRGLGAAQSGAGSAMAGAVPPTEAEQSVAGVPGAQEQLNALSGQSEALRKEGDTRAKLEQQAAEAQNRSLAETKADIAKTASTRDQITQDVLNGHINPNQYLENMSTGQKISTAIGLFLGGISSAQTGQPNPAMQFLQSQIERNLKSQELNQANKHTLLNALERQFGDKIVAANMFRSIDANIMAHKINQAAATSMSQQAQAAKQLGVGQLLQQSAMFKRTADLANLKAGVDKAPSGADMDARANNYLQAARIYDPKGAEEFEKRYIPNVGVASTPLVDKDRELLQKKTELSGLLKRAKDSLDSNDSAIGPIPFTKNHAEAQSLQQQINLRMGELSDLTRFTPEENKIYRQSVPDLTGTHFTPKDSTLLDNLIQTNDGSLNTFYKQRGINRSAGDTDSVKVLNPQGQSGNIPKAKLQQYLQKGYKLYK